MNESTSSFSMLYLILNGTILWGGLLVATYLWKWTRAHPADRKKCTERIGSRAWRTNLIIMLMGSVLTLYLLASGAGIFFSKEQLPVARLGITWLIYSILVGSIVAINRQRNSTWGTTFGMDRHELNLLKLSPVLYLAAMPFLMFAAQGYNWVLENGLGIKVTMQDAVQTIAEEPSWLSYCYIITAVFIAPVIEEIMFRGILFPYLVKRGGLKGGIVAVSVAFAAIHFHIPSLLPLFLLSVVLCLAYWRFGSLWVSIGIHALFNGVTALSIRLVS